MNCNLWLFRHRRYLVYALPADWRPGPDAASDVRFVWADAAVVHTLFRDDKRLRERFLELLARDCIGSVAVDSGAWVAYAWMTRPGTAGPAHLPFVRPDRASWIFHCRTREDFRGRGLYRRALTLLARRAQAEHARLYIDTGSDNLASQSGIRSVGFQPHGVASVWSFHLPRKVWTWGSWRTGRAHPEHSGQPIRWNPVQARFQHARPQLAYQEIEKP